MGFEMETDFVFGEVGKKVLCTVSSALCKSLQTQATKTRVTWLNSAAGGLKQSEKLQS
jgi:hypothetical protein